MGHSQYLTCIYLGVFFSSIAAGLSRLGITFYLAGLGASIVAVSSLTSWFMGARSLSAIIGSLLSDLSHSARRAIACTSMLLVSILVYAISLSHSVVFVMALNTLWGFVAGLFWPLEQTIASSLMPEKSGSVMSVYFTIGSLGVAAGQLLYGRLGLSDASALRLASILFLTASLFFIYVGLNAPLERIGFRRKRGPRSQRITFPTDALAFWIILAAFSLGYAQGILREFLYIYLHMTYGFSKAFIGNILFFSGLLALILVLAVGPISDRFGAEKTLSGLLVLGSFGFLLLGAGGSFTIIVAALSLALGAGRASLPLTRNAVVLGRGRGIYASLVGLSNMMSSLGQVVGPIVAGVLYSWLRSRRILFLSGRSIPFLLASLILMLSFILYLILAKLYYGDEGSGHP